LKKEIKSSLRFESVNLDSIYEVLDGISWLDDSTIKDIAQFSGIDPRTAGKVIKNCLQIGIVKEISKDFYKLTVGYPFKGTKEQKKEVIREAIFKMPLIISYRQFLKLGNNTQDALRKAATIQKIENFDKTALEPIIKWAGQLNALSLEMDIEDFANEGVKIKEIRHKESKDEKVVFLSHSSIDKPFIRQLAADLTKENILVWLDEQQIKVGDSINDKISQGLAESDYFVIALSDNSINSEWVKKELNSALIDEIEAKKVKVFPIKLSDCVIPNLIKDKKYADFTKSYKAGLDELLNAIK
jgi:CxxC motif-containing protein